MVVEDVSRGFPPVARPDARVLILGSLPGERSLRAGQYYAHPQNAFWRIMHDIAAADGGYQQRCQVLLERRIAVWDVLAASVRPGSMDADICQKSAKANDFSHFFTKHPEIERIAFNGQMAARLFARLVQPGPDNAAFEQLILPSTSPAYASMSYADKLARWRSIVA